MTAPLLRILISSFLLGALFACSPASEGNDPNTETAIVGSDGTGSFRVRNEEIREEMIQMINDADIEYWISDDGAINYNLADGEAIDRIGNEVISEYITRN